MKGLSVEVMVKQSGCYEFFSEVNKEVIRGCQNFDIKFD